MKAAVKAFVNPSTFRKEKTMEEKELMNTNLMEDKKVKSVAVKKAVVVKHPVVKVIATNTNTFKKEIESMNNTTKENSVTPLTNHNCNFKEESIMTTEATKFETTDLQDCIKEIEVTEKAIQLMDTCGKTWFADNIQLLKDYSEEREVLIHNTRLRYKHYCENTVNAKVSAGLELIKKKYFAQAIYYLLFLADGVSPADRAKALAYVKEANLIVESK